MIRPERYALAATYTELVTSLIINIVLRATTYSYKRRCLVSKVSKNNNKTDETILIVNAIKALSERTDLTESDKIERYLNLTDCLIKAVDRRSN